MRGSGIAYSAGSAPAASGGTSSRALAVDGAANYAGGIPFEGDFKACAGTTRQGLPCSAPATSENELCVGHNKQLKKLATLGDE